MSSLNLDLTRNFARPTITIATNETSYRDNARRLAEAISKTDPLHTLDQILEQLSERPDR